MSRRILTATLGVAGAITILLLFLSIRLSAPASQAFAQTNTDQVSPVHQITVVGRSDVLAVPDVAVIRIGVVTEETTATLALQRNNQQTQQVISQLNTVGIRKQMIQTESFSISPLYNRPGVPDAQTGTRNILTITGYQVTNLVKVRVVDLTQLGEVLGQVVEAGANQIYGIDMQVQNPDALLVQARSAAFRDARQQAQALADAAGGELGSVIAIDTTGSSVSPIQLANTAQVGAVPIEPGVTTVQAEVRATFVLE